MECRAGRVGFLGCLVRGANLAEDLALAPDHRVEPGRDAEEVEDGGLVQQGVERPLELAGREPGEGGECTGTALERSSRVLAREVKLSPVAGGERHCFAVLAGERGGDLTGPAGPERDELPKLHGSVAV